MGTAAEMERGSFRPPRQRVVITGLGALTPVGLSTEETWWNLVAGKSGISYITRFDASAYPTRIAGEIKGFDPLKYLDRKEARHMALFSQLAVTAAKMALADAQLTITPENAYDVGVLMGVAFGSLTETTEAHKRMLNGQRISPFYCTTIIPNMAAFHIGSALGALGYSSTVSTACAASTQSIGEATEVIRRGAAQVMIAGGTEDSLCELTMAGFCALGAFSTRNDDPEGASRPFDKDRDGFVASEGCAILILESLEHALRRGAHIYAEILGYGASSDFYHVASLSPDAEGPAWAMHLTMRDARLRPENIDYINAHGTSTPLNDATETLAIKKVLGERAYRVPISSTKSMIGHCVSAAGAIEAMVTALTIYHGVIHPTINYQTPDPECDLDYVPNVAREARVEVALSNSFGLGSQNACLALGKYGG